MTWGDPYTICWAEGRHDLTGGVPVVYPVTPDRVHQQCRRCGELVCLAELTLAGILVNEERHRVP